MLHSSGHAASSAFLPETCKPTVPVTQMLFASLGSVLPARNPLTFLHLSASFSLVNSQSVASLQDRLTWHEWHTLIGERIDCNGPMH